MQLFSKIILIQIFSSGVSIAAPAETSDTTGASGQVSADYNLLGQEFYRTRSDGSGKIKGPRNIDRFKKEYNYMIAPSSQEVSAVTDSGVIDNVQTPDRISYMIQRMGLNSSDQALYWQEDKNGFFRQTSLSFPLFLSASGYQLQTSRFLNGQLDHTTYCLSDNIKDMQFADYHCAVISPTTCQNVENYFTRTAAAQLGSKKTVDSEKKNILQEMNQCQNLDLTITETTSTSKTFKSDSVKTTPASFNGNSDKEISTKNQEAKKSCQEVLKIFTFNQSKEFPLAPETIMGKAQDVKSKLGISQVQKGKTSSDAVLFLNDQKFFKQAIDHSFKRIVENKDLSNLNLKDSNAQKSISEQSSSLYERAYTWVYKGEYKSDFRVRFHDAIEELTSSQDKAKTLESAQLKAIGFAARFCLNHPEIINNESSRELNSRGQRPGSNLDLNSKKQSAD
jgi:hypothetical protein